MRLPFRILNVFAIAGDAFSGNPLAVLEEPAGGLDAALMQQVARQFNLSESTFVRLTDAAGQGADATVRIYTTTIELPFAGHPTLGTASVVGGLTGRGAVVLRMPAGDIPVRQDAADPGVWTLTANPASVTAAELERGDVAAMVGVPPSQLAGPPVWVDSGIDQLLVPLTTGEALRQAQPDAALLRRLAMSPRGEALCLAWARTGRDAVTARFFFSQGSSLVEDPATGSAAANLGGLLAHLGERDTRLVISQGAEIQRPSRLLVAVDATGTVTVGGRVTTLGSGTLELDTPTGAAASGQAVAGRP